MLRLEIDRGISSVGRVLRSHRRGQGFESPILHSLPLDHTMTRTSVINR